VVDQDQAVRSGVHRNVSATPDQHMQVIGDLLDCEIDRSLLLLREGGPESREQEGNREQEDDEGVLHPVMILQVLVRLNASSSKPRSSPRCESPDPRTSPDSTDHPRTPTRRRYRNCRRWPP